jgi:hypothetical protein
MKIYHDVSEDAGGGQIEIQFDGYRFFVYGDNYKQVDAYQDAHTARVYVQETFMESERRRAYIFPSAEAFYSQYVAQLLDDEYQL